MHILLVEDNEDMRLATRGLLESAGHSVEAAVDAEEALDILAAPSAPLQGVVTDVELPGMSGTDLLRRLIGAGSSLPLVAASSLHRHEALEELESSGRVAFLRKPFSAAQLEEALVEAKAGSRRPVPPPQTPDTSPAPSAGASASSPGGGLLAKMAVGVPALGMSLLVVLSLGFGVIWKVFSVPPQLPSAPTSSVLRGGRILLDQPLGEISELPSQLSWAPAEEAQEYRVVLTTVDDTVFWQKQVVSTAVSLPAAVAERLERAVVYTWQVEALDAQGRTVARSERARFLLRLEPRISSAPPGGVP